MNMDNQMQHHLFSEFPPVTTQDWEDKIRTDLKGADYEKKLIWKTDEGFNVKPYYRAEDLDGLGYLDALPDSAPYVRGVKKESNDWKVRQDIYTSHIGEASRMALDAISHGAGAIGFDATEVTTHKQMNQLLAGIDLDKTAIHFFTSRSYPLTLELFIYEVSHRGSGGAKIEGSMNFDPLSYVLLRGDFYKSWTHNVEEAEYLLNTVDKRLPNFKAITVNGHYFQDAGSSLVQELAFSLAAANEYLASLTAKGFSVDSLASRIMFSLGVGSNYFMEIAKLRVARLLWSQMIGHYHPGKPESLKATIHASTALWNKTVFDPYVNMLRTTTEGMSAALGNADSITVHPFDFVFRTPDAFSDRIARNQQLVLKEESYLDKIVDPGAGSYYIENLTHSIAVHAWDLFKKVEAKGGMIEAVKSGFIQEEVSISRNRKEADIAQRKLVLLGTNQYPNPLDHIPDRMHAAEKPAAEGADTYPRLPRYRVAASFEEVRLATETHVARGGKRPRVFLLTMGNLAMLRARAGFAANFFGCAGYDIQDNPGFATADEAIASAFEADAELVVFCSSDDEYATIVPDIAAALKKDKPEMKLIVAGYPKEIIASLTAAGIDDFIHVKSNLLETLRNYQRMLNIL
jgi:methylmalonyl-CoA mutase